MKEMYTTVLHTLVFRAQREIESKTIPYTRKTYNGMSWYLNSYFYSIINQTTNKCRVNYHE